MKTCIFCLKNNLLQNKILLTNKFFYLCDTHDRTLIHSGMIIPYRHIQTPFDLTSVEWISLQKIIHKAKQYFDAYKPQGYNIGWNIGKDAGQTIEHMHLHVISRFKDEPYAGKGIRYYLRSSQNKRKR